MNRRTSRIALAAFTGAGLVSLSAVIHPRHQLIYNPSDSAPLGFYIVRPTETLRVGGYAFARLPRDAAALAHVRGYLPASVPILKPVAALSGATVCRIGERVTIDGAFAAEARTRDGRGRPLPAWTGCLRLAGDEAFLLAADRPGSFDGRYYGPVSTRNIIGEARPLWTW